MTETGCDKVVNPKEDTRIPAKEGWEKPSGNSEVLVNCYSAQDILNMSVVGGRKKTGPRSREWHGPGMQAGLGDGSPSL